MNNSSATSLIKPLIVGIVWLAFALSVNAQQPPAKPTATASRPQSAGQDLVPNADFATVDAQGNPAGWFRAMIPMKTTNLKAGVEKDAGRNVMFLSQDGTQGMLFNNWAHRIENPPVGAPLKIEAEVATEATTGKGGVVILMFFDAAGAITGAASSEGRFPLTGTTPWTKIELDATVPPRTDIAIMRIGLAAGATGKIKARSCRVIQAGEATASVSAPAAGNNQLLANPDFTQGELNGNPVGWFRAMIPAKTTNLKAGLAKDDKGPYIFLSQEGTQGNFFNNWAQRLDALPPAGTRLRLEAEVATRDASKGAVVMVMFFDAAGGIKGAISSEGQVDLSGTKSWTPVKIEGVVPAGAQQAIVRCGLGANGSGVLYVRNAELRKIK